MQAGVCITSLLINSDSNEYYDIFILCSENVSESNRQQIQNISKNHKNCQISFIDLSGNFDDAFEIRNITKATYYRLMIPLLIPQYAKVIYSDVDIIFQEGLGGLYNEDITDYYLAAVLSRGAVSNKEANKYICSLNLNPDKYVQCGFIIINSSKMIEDDICSKFKSHSNRNYLFVDQDIINIVCAGRIKNLPLKYNFTQDCFSLFFTNKSLLLQRYVEDEIMDALNRSIIHYEGTNKPWNSDCLRHDIWWEYYRKSVFFDYQFYYDSSVILFNKTLTLKHIIKIIIFYCKKVLKNI
jgi:lipopolysaccharide biosynthesis glycosyltransferase